MSWASRFTFGEGDACETLATTFFGQCQFVVLTGEYLRFLRHFRQRI